MQPSQSDQMTMPAPMATADTVVVEAETAAAALEEVQRTHGVGARILQAEKVRRGGIGGFFAKELVQLTVAPEGRGGVAPEGRGGAAPAMPDLLSGPAFDPMPAPYDPHAGETFGELLDRRAAGGGLADVVAELTAATDSRESTFGDALRAAVGPLPEPTPVATRAAATPRPTTNGSLLRGAPLPSDPRLASGATMLAAAAERVEPTLGDTLVAAPPHTEPSPVREVEHAEAALDAAVRAVTAGATAGSVLRAAESGGSTNFEPLFAAAATPLAVTEPVVAPTEEAEGLEVAAPSRGAVAAGRWSAERLTRLGLPEVLVRTIVGQHPRDDVSWFTATARAVEPLCRRGPGRDAIHVGPLARRITAVTDAKLMRLSDTAPRRGSLALACTPSDRAMSWLDRGRRGREVHLVVGGNGWRDWVWEELDAIAWSGPESLVEALTVAVQLGLPLTGAPDGDRFAEATAVDIAVSLRGMLER